jgi:protocatechuate 3,4-dioxygenase beta subunit
MSRPQSVIAIAVLLTSTLLAHAQQARDNVRPRAAGSAAVYGVVTSGGVEPQPLRRARVVVSGLDVEYSQTVITADDGTYRLEGLAAGSYTVRGSKEAFVTTTAGARRTAGAGSSITLDAGEQRRIDLRLPRGSVITGRVHNANGEPASGILVSALVNRYVPSAGERRMVPVTSAGVLTDDRGVYRIYGLPPGEYFVTARPRPGPELDLQVLTDAEVRAALATAARTLWNPGRPGSTAPPPPRPVAIEPPRRTVGLTQIYFPGTPFLERARSTRLGEAEVRNAIDFDLDYVPLATIEGAVSLPLGAMRVQITLSGADPANAIQVPRFASASENGQFTFRSVPPGRYRVVARVGSVTPAPGSSVLGYAGAEEIVVSGDDIAGLVIPMRPPLTLSGRLTFDPPQEGVASLQFAPRLPLVATGLAGAAVMPTVNLEGERFTLSGIVPGTYRFTTTPPGVRTPVGRWWLKSAVVAGRELLDSPLEFRESGTDAVLTWSERASEVSGNVRSQDGRGAGGVLVVIFSRDESGWFLHSRRVAAVRPDRDGRYVVRNLPPGEYLITATSALEPNEWFDPELLRGLSGSAQPLRVDVDGRHEADVVIGR